MKITLLLPCFLVLGISQLTSATPTPRTEHNEDFETDSNSTESPWDSRDARDYPSYETLGSRCPETPCFGINNNRDRGPKRETSFVYRERDHKCIKESVNLRVEDPDECSCVPWEVCPSDSIVNTRKRTRTRGRNDNKNARQLFPYSTDDSGLDTIIADRRVQSNRPTRRRMSTSPTRSKCGNGEVCCRNQFPSSQRRKSQPKPTTPVEGSCGRRSACGTAPSKIPRKKGQANIAEYPWNAIILYALPNGDKEFLCNGALIDQRRILTVAQCVEPFETHPELLDIRLGEYDLEEDYEPDPFEEYQVRDIRIHPKYDNHTLANDIAILNLEEYVHNTPHISPVCVPGEREVFESESCVATGWGSSQPRLQEFFVDCMTDEECIERLRSTRVASLFDDHLPSSFFCAQSRHETPCLIDAGGPLVCRRTDGTYAIIGLLSWSVDEITSIASSSPLTSFLRRSSDQKENSSLTEGDPFLHQYVFT